MLAFSTSPSYATPDPHGHFFGKLRYGADQYDVYGRLIEKMGGQEGWKFGGDAAPKAATKSLPKKVRLVDLFSGPVQLNEQGEAEIGLDVPDFNGTLRLMAVVAAPDKFGSAEAETIVAAPLVAELMTPFPDRRRQRDHRARPAQPVRRRAKAESPHRERRRPEDSER